MTVVHRAGGGNQIAYAYVNQRPADGHLVLANKTLLTNHLVGQGISYTDLTPVAHMFGEYIAVMDRDNVQVKAFLIELGLAK